MEKKKIYFAGKIKAKDKENECYLYDWRNNILNDTRHQYYVDRKEFETFVYTGPKYYREHCYVSDGVTDHEGCFYEAVNAISESDIVFCYLNQMDSYGTIAEIGLAYGMCKEIYIYYTKEIDKQELLFVFQFATKVGLVENELDAREELKKEMRGSLHSMPYNLYLQTDYWKQLSTKRKEIDGNKCKLCDSSKKLNAHHRSYKNRGLEGEINDLITLCNNCHSKFHDK